MPYVPLSSRDLPLDGLRGLAVLMIIFAHLNLMGFAWISMQLFFVLSGFLITRILIHDAGERRLPAYLRAFYLRRVLRILPAAYLYLAVVALCAWLLSSFDVIAARLQSAALFYFNFQILLDTQDLPFTDAWAFSFNHLWSLAVEEHFYLLWPFLVYFALKTRCLLALSIMMVLLGPVLRWVSAQIWLDAGWSAAQATGYGIYILSTTHLDAFATGGLVAVLAHAAPAPRRTPSLGFWLLAATAAYALGVLNNGSWGMFEGRAIGDLGYPALMREGSQYVWGYSILNLLFAQLVWLCLHHPLARAVFSLRPLTFAGEISYGLYLVHFPLLFLFLQLRPAFVQLLPWQLGASLCWIATYLAVSMSVAWLSFRYYETPFLRLKHRLSEKSRGVAASTTPAVAYGTA